MCLYETVNSVELKEISLIEKESFSEPWNEDILGDINLNKNYKNRSKENEE